MRLTSAKFCIDCEEIFEGPECPVCGALHSVFLSNWIKSFIKFRP